MSLDHVTIEPLPPATIAESVALAREVGWPDDDADWQVIHDAAFVLGARRDDILVGQGVLAGYESHAGTIAKMIVSPSAQRQGIGARILDALVTEAERRALTTLGLVATPFGQPLYASRGFVVTGEVAVFIGEPSLDSASHAMPELTDVEPAVRFEHGVMNCSRAAMLRARHRAASATALCRAPDGVVRGFALATTKGPYALVGPVIADGEETARALARAIFSAIPGAIRLDVPAEHASFREWLRGLGLPEKGVRAEMARGGALPWQVPQRFALATQAWG